MSRKGSLFATVAGLSVLGLAAPAGAQIWPFGRDRDAAAEAPATPEAAAPAQPEGAAERRPANAEQRAQAARLDPLARAVFWAAEVRIAPTDVESHIQLARAQRELRRFEEAASSAQQALVLEPGNRIALMELGRVHIARGQAFYAIAPLEQARAAYPRDWEIVSLLGVALDQVSRGDEAREAWNQALALSPENPSVLTNMAMSLAGAGQAAEAEALLRRAVAQPGATLQMRLNLALMIGLQGRLAEAEGMLRRDLPPEMVEQNLTWLRRTSAPAAPSGSGRTWEALRGG
ncbi:tetratricopeptide repeat protein [Brevundimonas sp.]|uniref:tetratricopeptide repeat protein n=1 Tax=Brevundimonas sp. TaxID=1871086 RepID=UPI0025E3FBC5|nr:tetratricopeptide repeat protein [Brevundimonas sp.]